MNIRVGHGYDAHQFGEGDFITLAGVKISFQQGIVAHSDGDVVIHAVCDALLGAIACGDIGEHFPDTDDSYRDIDSRIFLKQIVVLLTQEKWRISNIDITIIAQAPKLMPYKEKMCNNLAKELLIDTNQINIKATTNEGMGFIGRGEGVAVHAVALLYNSEKTG